MSEQNHPWCRDVSRDEAIRRAEDAAAAERTPPPDHRDLLAAVAGLRERVGSIESLIRKAAVAGSFDGVGVPPSPATRPGETAAKHSPPPSDGLRTERVVLEITQRADRYHPLAAWDWPGTFDGLDRLRGESVRVVDEVACKGSGVFDPNGDELPWDGVVAMLTAERDAARQECERLSARVAELERAYSAECDARAQAQRELSDLNDAIRARESGEERDNSYAALCREAAAARERADRMISAPAANAGGEKPQPPRGWLTKEDGEALYLACAVLHGVFVGSWREKHDAAKRLEAIRVRAIREAGGEVV